MKLQPRTIVNLAFAGFVLTVFALAAHVARSVQGGGAAFEDVVRANKVSSAYYQALNAATLAELHATRFFITPNAEDRREYDNALRDSFAATNLITEEGTESDQQRISDLFNEYAPRIVNATRTFAALERGEPVTDLIPTTSLIQQVQDDLRAQATLSQEAAAHSLSDFRANQRSQQLASLSAFAVAVPLMLALLMVIRHYERGEIRSEVAMRRLEHAALTDSLTGLGNHRAFQEELSREVAEARSLKQTLALAVADVDRFKDINDSEGHAKGDQILLQLGKLWQKAAGDRQVFRIGGDEFAVLLPSWDADSARGFMESLRMFALDGLGGSTVSIGLAAFEDEDDSEILREKADIALYLAKRRGRNAVSVYAGEGGISSPVTQAKIDSFRYLLQYASVNVAFQPVFLTEGRDIVGFEALTRIPPRFGLEGPQEAFDIAERLGRSYDLDMICINAILARAAEIPEDAILFLNLAPRSLEHAEFTVGSLHRMVVAAGFRPERICFELTERSSASVEVVQRVVGELAAVGFRIALDDVGAGNSGLEMLRVIPVDYVKIDHSVVRGAVEPGTGRAVLMAIVAFASEAGAFVIAEGIENEDMLRLVEGTSGRTGAFRIHGLQGYLLGRPSESFTDVLESRLAA
ncbi:MAG TPA: EAL domain-containing protein [Dehalococcoidia bacterium]|nr:EAL domain-containing protein [Dehalococcoidia bacterium]